MDLTIVVFDWFNMHEPHNKYPEMEQWLVENTQGFYKRHDSYCDAYEFELTEDAMAFKLRWM